MVREETILVYICEKCNAEFRDETKAQEHEDIPFKGAGIDCLLVEDLRDREIRNILIMEENGFNENHDRLYTTFEIELIQENHYRIISEETNIPYSQVLDRLKGKDNPHHYREMSEEMFSSTLKDINQTFSALCKDRDVKRKLLEEPCLVKEINDRLQKSYF